MNIFLNVGLPILCPLVYATVGLMVFHRFRRRHLRRGCIECERKIKDNLSNRYGLPHAWNNLLCDKYDMGAALTAAFWPFAWIGFKLNDWVRVDDRPSWLLEQELRARIEELELEAGISR